MKKWGGVVAFGVLFFLLIPMNIYAIENNLDISFFSGSGDFKPAGASGSADVESIEMDFVYTHYVQTLETDESPYGVRDFLQHPSNFGVAYFTYDWEAEDAGDSLELNGKGFAFGGMFYASNKSTPTGFGLTYLSQDTDLDMVVGGVPVLSYESEYKMPVLTVQQYVNATTRIGLSYSMTDAETNNISHDENILTIKIESFIDKLWLSAYYLNGKDDWPSGYFDDDISGFGIKVGGYPNQQLGLFFMYNNKETDDDSSELEVTNMALEGDYYLDEKVHFRFVINKHKEDDPTFAKNEETILTVGAGFYF